MGIFDHQGFAARRYLGVIHNVFWNVKGIKTAALPSLERTWVDKLLGINREYQKQDETNEDYLSRTIQVGGVVGDKTRLHVVRRELSFSFAIEDLDEITCNSELALIFTQVYALRYICWDVGFSKDLKQTYSQIQKPEIILFLDDHFR